MINEEENVLVLTNDIGKTCKKCHRFLSQYHYYPKYKRSSALQEWCIDCQKEYKQKRKAILTIKEFSIGSKSLREIADTIDVMDRTSLVLLRKILTNILKIIERRLKR